MAYQHRLWYGVFIIGRYWFLPGHKEVGFLKWSQVIFGNATENGVPVEYIIVIHHFYKGHQLTITNTTACSKKDVAPKLYKNAKRSLCPVKFFEFFRLLCCPEQERVFCKAYNVQQMKKWNKRKNLTYTTLIYALEKTT